VVDVVSQPSAQSEGGLNPNGIKPPSAIISGRYSFFAAAPQHALPSSQQGPPVRQQSCTAWQQAWLLPQHF
jgi:hypothetical protein